MLKIKNLRGQCQNCGETIEFHAEHVGTTADCPHCGQPTELCLDAPPEENSPARTKALVFTVIAILILGGGLFGAMLALKRAERLKAERLSAESQQITKPADVFSGQEYRVSPVVLEQGAGSSIVYAVGTILNTATRQRFGVKVELELYDAAGVKLSGASDYQKILEPGAEWKYRALVVDKRAVSAKVAAIKESQ